MTLALLDTDTLSELLKKKNAIVAGHAADYLAQHQQFAISAFTRYEVLRGLTVINATRRIADFEIFCQNAEVFSVTETVLDRAVALWALAHRGGHPRYDADLIIAATAIENGRILVTGNTAHFSWIPGLILQDWRDA